MTPRRNLLRSLVAGMAFPFLPLTLAAEDDTPKKPHLLFLLVDDLRTQLNCYGHPQMITPNIDMLAENGVLFERAYCNFPVCGASRCSMLTGLRPTPTRFTSYDCRAAVDAPGVIDLPSQLKSNGYTTVSNGKVYHHGNDNKESFDDRDSPPGFLHYILEENKAYMAAGKTNENQRWKWPPPCEAPDVPDNALQGGMIAEKVLADFDRAEKEGTPAFVVAGFTKPHLPFIAPKKYWDMYGEEDIDLADNPFFPVNCPEAFKDKWWELRAYKGIPKDGPVSREQAKELVHGYYACVTFTDAMIGEILRGLKKRGILNDTYIVLVGDHGWQLEEHGQWCKNRNFNDSMQAPLVVYGPGIRRGVRTDALAEYVDLYPTFCDMAGAETPAHVEGDSLMPFLTGATNGTKDAVHCRTKRADSVITDRYCYTERRDKDGAMTARMLYDHVKDPAENVNIAEMPDNATLVEKLSGMIADHLASVE